MKFDQAFYKYLLTRILMKFILYFYEVYITLYAF
jgi:hypothetical protein